MTVDSRISQRIAQRRRYRQSQSCLWTIPLRKPLSPFSIAWFKVRRRRLVVRSLNRSDKCRIPRTERVKVRSPKLLSSDAQYRFEKQYSVLGSASISLSHEDPVSVHVIRVVPEYTRHEIEYVEHVVPTDTVYPSAHVWNYVHAAYFQQRECPETCHRD
jgi:hypothetical protein